MFLPHLLELDPLTHRVVPPDIDCGACASTRRWGDCILNGALDQQDGAVDQDRREDHTEHSRELSVSSDLGVSCAEQCPR